MNPTSGFGSEWGELPVILVMINRDRCTLNIISNLTPVSIWYPTWCEKRLFLYMQ